MTERIVTHHLVRKEDLNHHGSLYAGRSADWIIETAYAAAASLLPTDSIVIAKINEISYLSPIHAGEVTRFEGRAAYAGHSSLMIYVSAWVQGEKKMEGFLTVVHIGDHGRPSAHGIVLPTESEEDKALEERAKSLKNADR